MKLLAIDTSTMRGSIALIEDGEVVDVTKQAKESNHSEWLFQNIKALLDKNRFSFPDINALAVAVGPGSFTGLRIGIAAAKGIALSLSIPILGVSSLEALAYNVAYEGPIVPIVDARRSEVYFAGYRLVDGHLDRIIDEAVGPPSDLIRKLLELEDVPLLIGDGVARYEDLFRGEGDKFKIDGNRFYSDASGMGVYASKQIEAGKSSDLSSLGANYIRCSDAQIGFKGIKL